MMCCYHPTTTVVVDDDEDFLNIFNHHLKLQNCALFSSPTAAVISLNNKNSFERIRKRLLKTTQTQENTSTLTPEHYSLNINLRGLHEEIYSLDRFDDVSVIIVDYHMNDINGIDLCQKLSAHPAKKLLLTGGADKEKVAIEAFNQGIIHRFISKTDINFPTLLKQAVTVLKEAYFKDLTHTIIPHLPPSSTQLLKNSAYINLTHTMQNELNAVEYYLLDASGSIVFLNTEGQPSWLIIKSDTELVDYEQIAKDSDAENVLLQSLIQRKAIPFFFSEADYEQPVEAWGKHLHPAKILPGIPGYYCALINETILNDEKKNRIAPYAKYIKKLL